MGLQFQEVLVGLQVGIVLGDGQQFAQRGGQLALGGLVFGQLFRCEVGGVHLDLRGFAACLDDALQGLLLVGGIAFDGVHQVGDEVGAALVLRLHVGPLVAYSFVHADEVVVSAYAPNGQQGDDCDNDDGCCLLHTFIGLYRLLIIVVTLPGFSGYPIPIL